jgi:calmodulin
MRLTAAVLAAVLMAAIDPSHHRQYQVEGFLVQQQQRRHPPAFVIGRALPPSDATQQQQRRSNPAAASFVYAVAQETAEEVRPPTSSLSGSSSVNNANSSSGSSNDNNSSNNISYMPALGEDGIYQVSNALEHAALMEYARDRVVVLKVYAPWCRACKGLEPKFQKISTEPAYNRLRTAEDGSSSETVLWANLSVQHNKAFVQSLGVLVLPTIQFYVGGKLLDTFPCGPSKLPILKTKLAGLVADHLLDDGTLRPESVELAAAAAEEAGMKIKEQAQKREADRRAREEAAAQQEEVVDDEVPKMSPHDLAVIRKIPYFTSMSLADLDDVLDKAVQLTFQPGSVILKEGKPGQMFYVISEGEVEICQQTSFSADPMVQSSVPGNSKYLGTVINRLGPGEYFGERALITGEPRAASLRVADTPATVWAFDKNNFPHSCILSGRSLTQGNENFLVEVNDKYGISNLYEQQVLSKQLRESSAANQVRGSVNTPEPLAVDETETVMDDELSTVSSIDSMEGIGDTANADEYMAASMPIPSVVSVEKEDTIFSLLTRFQMIRHVSSCVKYIQQTQAVWGVPGIRTRRNMLVSRLSPSLRSEFTEIFHLMDSNGDGKIELDELKRLMESIGEKQSDDQLLSVMGGNAVNGKSPVNGGIAVHGKKSVPMMTYEDYMGIMAESEFYNLFTEIFSSLDEKKSGYVKARDLDRVLCGVRDLISDDRKSVIDVDDKDMLIDYEQFSRMLLGTTLI